MGTTTLLTVEQFEQMPEDDSVRYELQDGELIPMGVASSGHEMTKFAIVRCLILYIAQHPIGQVYCEAGFALTTTLVRKPDVSFLRNELVEQADRAHAFRGAPGLAIEVVSENESAAVLQRKIREYLQAGAKAVWSFYPMLRMIAVHDKTGVRELQGDEVLEAPEILPGFRATVNQFFE